MTSDRDKTTGLQADGALLISVPSASGNTAGRSDPDEVCREIIELAMDVIPCAAADLTHDMHGGSMRMTASSDPAMSERASSSGGSQLTFRLPMGSQNCGVLRFHFSDAPVDEDVRRLASAFAGHAGVALDRVALRTQVSHLLTALDTNREIGAAVGVLMARRGVGYDDAFALLRRESQRANRKLRLVASDVLYTGALPDTGTSPARPPAAPERPQVSRTFTPVAVGSEVTVESDLALASNLALASEPAVALEAVGLGQHDDRFAAT